VTLGQSRLVICAVVSSLYPDPTVYHSVFKSVARSLSALFRDSCTKEVNASRDVGNTIAYATLICWVAALLLHVHCKSRLNNFLEL
jgi:hypothetical protein